MYQARWKTWLEKYLCLTNHSQGLEKPYNKKGWMEDEPALVAAPSTIPNIQSKPKQKINYFRSLITG
jgi:hypothetical protein